MQGTTEQNNEAFQVRGCGCSSVSDTPYALLWMLLVAFLIGTRTQRRYRR